MGAVLLTDGENMVTGKLNAVTVRPVRDPDKPLPFHALYRHNAVRGIHPRDCVEKGQLPSLPCEAKQAGRLQPFAGKKLRLAVCQLQHDVNGLQIALVYRALAVADHILLKVHEVCPRPKLTQHNIHSVL